VSENPAMVVVACACGQKMKVPEDASGRTFKCVRCGEHLKVGQGGATPARPPEGAARPGANPGAQEPPPPPAEEPIGQRLIASGLITEEQLNDALAKQRVQGGKTFELLIALGHLDKDQLHDFLSRQPGIAAIDLSRCNISPDLIKLVPKKLAVENLVLPIDQLGKLLTVAMACPLDVGTIALLERATGLRVKAMLCKLEDIHNAVQKYYPDRSRFEMSLSHLENIMGSTADGPKEKVEGYVRNWGGALVDAPRKDSLLSAISGAKSLDLVVSQVLAEPTLSAFVMRVANSDVYGMPGQIESVPMAVAVLGKAGVLGVLENFVEPALPNVLDSVTPFAAQARLTAAIAAGLAREGGPMGEHAAYSLGLLGEIGRVALAAISPVKYKRVKAHLYGASLSEYERRYFSMDHTEFAGALSDAWRYPVHVTKALRYYQVPAEAKEAEASARLLGLAITLAYTPADATDALLAAEAKTVNALNINAVRVGPIVEDARLVLAADGRGDG